MENTLSETPNTSGEGTEFVKLITRPMFTTGLRATGDAGHPSNLRLTSPTRRHVAKIYAASQARDEVAEANAALYTAAPDLYNAAMKVLAGLDARIKAASDKGQPVPLFDGIGELHNALSLASKPVTKSPKGQRP